MTVTDTPMEAVHVRPQPKRDQWGRYRIPHPETGKEQSWTRATTWAKTVSDTFGLTKWELRMSALGLARRPDLLAQVATVTDPDNTDAKQLLDRMAREAKEAAGSSVRANLGTALHAFTEQIDQGLTPTAPDAHVADLDAYRATVSGLAIDPRHIERIVVIPELGVAGTFDRLATYDGRLMVTDLKTGRDLRYSWGEIAVQLALYARASHLYDVATGTFEPMPEVDRSQALVLHLPVGEGRCTAYTVDIAEGWRMALICGEVRDWRRRKNLSAEVDVSPAPPATSPTDRTQWIVDRIGRLKADTPERVAVASGRWPTGVAKRPPWTDPEIDAIDAVLVQVEGSWPPADPATVAAKAASSAPPVEVAVEVPALPDPGSDGDPVEAVDIAGIRSTIASLAEEQRWLLTHWAKEARAAGRPWDDIDGMVERHWHIARGIVRLLVTFGGPDRNRVRRAVEYALVDDLHPTVTTGAALGSLSIAQAIELAEIAAAYRTGDTAVRAVIDDAA